MSWLFDWFLHRRRLRCVACGNTLREGDLAAFVPCYGDEAHPAVHAGNWCHHGCLEGLSLEVGWTISDVRAAGFLVKKPGAVKKVSLPRAERPS